MPFNNEEIFQTCEEAGFEREYACCNDKLCSTDRWCGDMQSLFAKIEEEVRAKIKREEDQKLPFVIKGVRSTNNVPQWARDSAIEQMDKLIAALPEQNFSVMSLIDSRPSYTSEHILAKFMREELGFELTHVLSPEVLENGFTVKHYIGGFQKNEKSRAEFVAICENMYAAIWAKKPSRVMDKKLCLVAVPVGCTYVNNVDKERIPYPREAHVFRSTGAFTAGDESGVVLSFGFNYEA